MALIKCPECGNETLSEFAPCCPICNCPMNVIKELINGQQKNVKEERKLFLETIRKEQRDFILGVVSNISIDFEKKKILAIEETSSYYAIKCINHPGVKCYFVNNSKSQLQFSYEDSSNNVRQMVIIDEINKYARGKAVRLIEKMLRENEEDIYFEKQNEKGSKKDKHLFKIFPKLKKEMNDKYYEATLEEKKLCKDIKEYLLGILSLDSDRQLRSVTCSSPHHLFFGHLLKWDTADGYVSTAIVYFYYKSWIIVKKIRQYEKIFKERIILDNQELNLLHELYHQFDESEEININICKSVNSNISLIPESTFNDILNWFKQFE